MARTKPVRHTRANYDRPTEGVTIYTEENRNFIGSDPVNAGDDFMIVYADGRKRFGTASRDGSTIYFQLKNFQGMGRLPSRSRKNVFHEVAAIVRL